ncbi:MAG: lipopolysaccharide assembly protein LapB [Nevskia sp.]
MFENLLSWLLLPLGVAFGLSLARKREVDPDAPHRAASSAPGVAKIDDDQAISVLSRGAETEPGVVDLQMTLGSLFRKRGEVERAIQLHEAVLARPMLTAKDAAYARHELAQDYLRAGLMDRAESLLQALVTSGEQLAPALELLLDLYEQGRDWPQAIVTASRLEGVLGSSLAARIAHYHCELADSALHGGDLQVAQREAEHAVDSDRGCARASLLLAELAEKRGDSAVAIRAYSRAAEQDRRYLPEILAPLKRCFEAAGASHAYIQYLDDAEIDHPDSVPVALAKAEQLRAEGVDAQSYLAERLAAKPNWRGLLLWLEGQAADDPDAAKVRKALRSRLDARPRYSCSSCGLTPSVLFWQCPSCKQWATIAPAVDAI